MEDSHFAENLTSEEIQSRIKKLVNHKIIKEIDLLLKELRRRKEHFRYRIFSEMFKPPNKEEG